MLHRPLDLGNLMDADLEALLIALYVVLTDDIIPSPEFAACRGRSAEVTDAELVCLAVAQAYHGSVKEREWLRKAVLVENSSHGLTCPFGFGMIAAIGSSPSAPAN